MKKTSVSRGFIPFPRRSKKMPVVFMLQPKGVKPNVTPADLKLWEQWMVERVGFATTSPAVSAHRTAIPKSKAVAWPNGGISGSNGGWDD